MSLVSPVAAREFARVCLEAAGAAPAAARAQAELLLHADLSGHHSHGLSRLEQYVCDLESGAARGAAAPALLRQSAAAAWVDGGHALGAVTAGYCMRLAIDKARRVGVGWVVAKRCSHFGMAGYWAARAADEGLLGLAFTNTSPLMVPARAKEAALGSNPIAMAAPAEAPAGEGEGVAAGVGAGEGAGEGSEEGAGDARERDSLVVDLATTTVAMGKVEQRLRRGAALPAGWALGPDGRHTDDPALALAAARLRPLGAGGAGGGAGGGEGGSEEGSDGGGEEGAGHKGYALAALVEVLCSGLSGSLPSHEVRAWRGPGAPLGLGQCFVAVDPAAFAPGLPARVAALLRHWRQLEPSDPARPVLAPGDAERAARAGSARGVRYPAATLAACRRLARRLRVPPMPEL